MHTSVGTANMGEGFDLADMLRLLTYAGVWGTQEGSDKEPMFRKLRERGFKVTLALFIGQAATRVVWSPGEFKRKKRVVKLLLARIYVGPGAGPSFCKPKWLMGHVFEHKQSGLEFIFVNCHFVASPQFKRRMKAQIKMLHKIAKWTKKQKLPIILVGDFNMKHGAERIDILRDAGFYINYSVKTHPHGSLDYVCWTKEFDFLDLTKIQTGSSHDALGVALSAAA